MGGCCLLITTSSASGQIFWWQNPYSQMDCTLFVLSPFLAIAEDWISSKSATADGILSATSNLVLKGIMGIYAMGQINKVLEARGADSSLTSHYLVSHPSCGTLSKSLLSWIATRIQREFSRSSGKTLCLLQTMSFLLMETTSLGDCCIISMHHGCLVQISYPRRYLISIRTLCIQGWWHTNIFADLRPPG